MISQEQKDPLFQLTPTRARSFNNYIFSCSLRGLLGLLSVQIQAAGLHFEMEKKKGGGSALLAGAAEWPLRADHHRSKGCGAALCAAGGIVERQRGSGRAVVGAPAAAAAFVSREESTGAHLWRTERAWKMAALCSPGFILRIFTRSHPPSKWLHRVPLLTSLEWLHIAIHNPPWSISLFRKIRPPLMGERSCRFGPRHLEIMKGGVLFCIERGSFSLE